MAGRKQQKRSQEGQLAKFLTASAQQIWNAGVGALALAEKEGGKLFESLSAVGAMLQSGTRKTVQRKVDLAENTAASVKDSASGAWDRLELIFEHRVARALNALQIPTAADVKGLSRRVEELQAAVKDLKARGSAASGKKGGKATKKKGRKKAGRSAAAGKTDAKKKAAKKARAKTTRKKAATRRGTAATSAPAASVQPAGPAPQSEADAGSPGR